ncbi:MAG: methionyl-tRNA formyltransferase [Phycisphaerales bacterium]
MKVVFLGSGAFGLPTLEHLARTHQVTGVVTQPDRPAGRGGKVTPTPVGAWAEAHLAGTPLLKPERINTPLDTDALRALEADAWVVIAFGQKLGKALLAERFAINLHASLLPKWRGAAPINAAILAGDLRTGNSVITLADRMDAGLILGASERVIEPTATAGELHDLLASDGPALVERVLQSHVSGTLVPTVQEEPLVTLAPKLSRADAWVDFTQHADDCRRRINGLSPWPGVTVEFRGQPLKLLRAGSAGDVALGPPGSIIDPLRGVVRCAAGTGLTLLEVQPAGRKPCSWRDFANGQRLGPEELLRGGRPKC